MPTNEQNFQYIAAGGTPDHYGILSDLPVQQFQSIQKYATSIFKTQPEEAEKINGCLDKLSAVLFQIARIRDHYASIALNAIEVLKPKRTCIALRGLECCVDFESLLLQGRASHDRL